jgi:hypothetical protein
MSITVGVGFFFFFFCPSSRNKEIPIAQIGGTMSSNSSVVAVSLQLPRPDNQAEELWQCLSSTSWHYQNRIWPQRCWLSRIIQSWWRGWARGRPRISSIRRYCTRSECTGGSSAPAIVTRYPRLAIALWRMFGPVRDPPLVAKFSWNWSK